MYSTQTDSLHQKDLETLYLILPSLFCSPNLCMNTKIYEVQTYSYTYQQHCRRSFWGRSSSCSLYCVRGDECDGNMVNTTKRNVECCDGFGIDPTQSSSRYRRHGSSHLSLRNGCPISMYYCMISILHG